MSTRSIFIIIFIIVVAVIGTLFLLTRGIRSNVKVDEKANVEVIEDNSVKLGSAVDDPIVFNRAPIEIQSHISDWVTERSFILSESNQGGFFGGGRTRELLVISDKAFDLPQHASGKELARGDEVNVKITGTLHILDRDELSEKLGLDLDGEEIKLDDGNIEEWKLGPVFYVESVEKTE